MQNDVYGEKKGRGCKLTEIKTDFDVTGRENRQIVQCADRTECRHRSTLECSPYLWEELPISSIGKKDHLMIDARSVGCTYG